MIFTLAILISASVFAAPVASEEGIFKNESELGVVVATGNAKTTAVSITQTNSYEWAMNVLRFNARYLGTRASGLETGRYFKIALRYEREITEKLSFFAAETFESDIFVGYNRRFNTDVGAKYHIVKSKETNWSVEGGYRHISENQVTNVNISTSNIRLFTEASHEFNKSLTGKVWLEGIRNFSDSRDYRLSGEVSLSVLLTEILSFKTSYLVRYQNLPSKVGAERTDTLLTSALVAKF